MKVRGPRAALTFSLRAKYREGAYRGPRAIPGLDFQTDALPIFTSDVSWAAARRRLSLRLLTEQTEHTPRLGKAEEATDPEPSRLEGGRSRR